MSAVWGVLLLTIRMAGLGWVWTPLLESGPTVFSFARLLDRCGRIAAAGVLLNALLALAAAVFQQWTPGVDWALWGLATGGGLLRMGMTSRFRKTEFADALGAILAIGLLVALVAAAPVRSEWLAGGWDPGIYQNSALSIARHNGVRPATDTGFADLSPAERELASWPEGQYREVFPAVPIRMRDGALPTYFFPFTPMCGAWLFRLGGLDLLHRMPALFAVLGLLPAFALFGALELPKGARWIGVLFWVLSPVWWYLQAIPVSEMPQLFLLCAAALFYADAVRQKKTWPVLAALALFAGTANRFDFPVFAGLFLVLAAWGESANDSPGWRRRNLSCFAALAGGLLWDAIASGVAISRLQEKDQVLWVVLLPFALAATGAMGLAGWRRPARISEPMLRSARLAGRCAAVAFAGLVVLLAFPPLRDVLLAATAKWPVAGGMVGRFFRILTFHGVGWFGGVAVGVAWAAWDRNPAQARWRLALAALGAALSMLWLHGGIAPIYPWALRRYFVYLTPFMALALAYAAAGIAAGWKNERRSFAALGFILLVWAGGDGVRKSMAAGRVGDYRGFSAVVENLAEQIRPSDWVVADDPRWGTPLLLAHGRNVLDGKRLWASRDPDFQRKYLQMLRRLQREDGRRVLWLTSTALGLEIFPVDVGAASPLFTGRSFAYRTVVHGARADHFAMSEQSRVFGLHEWKAEAATAPPPALAE